jgi:uncharacterized protein (TIGR02453 family)
MENFVLGFLEELHDNNNREWFNENKKRYEKARKEMETFVDALIPELLKIDPAIGTLTAKQTLFRIYRDIRFSKDKSPYKDHFGAFLAPGGRKSTQAGYYIHVSAQQSFLGGGAHSPSGEDLKKIRSEIFYNAEEFKSIIGNKKFKETFSILEGDKLVRPPAGFPGDFPDIELLKYKSYTVFRNIDKKEINDSSFNDEVLRVFRTMHPFIAFLNRALQPVG